MGNAKRVVITGMGSVTPVGLTSHEAFCALVAGRSGLRRMTWPAETGISTNVGAPILGFPQPAAADDGLPRRSRVSELALAAAREAIETARLRHAAVPSERIATIVGVGMGDSFSVQKAAARFLETSGSDMYPGFIDGFVPAAVNDLIAQYVGATGPSYCVVSACASAAHAIGEAFELVRSGEVEVAITGGAEAVLDPLAISTFERIGALSQYAGDPEHASRPFDRDRDGFVMGEGAALVVLETAESARRRGARIYAELLGYGASADAFHVTRPCEDGAGMASAIEAALRCAGVAPAQVQYVNAHGTGTPFNDTAETAALKRVFGAHAHKLWISSNKSMTGHMLGAAGAAETVATAYTLAEQIAPPTINLDNPDEACDLDYVPRQARRGALDIAINNSFGFGGQNACLVLARHQA